jgi:uncharacterized protein (DUF1330 family)
MPAGITISEVNVKDPDAYKAWLPGVQKGIADYGGAVTSTKDLS